MQQSRCARRESGILKYTQWPLLSEPSESEITSQNNCELSWKGGKNMRDVETLRSWIRVLLIVTAVCVTLFPVLYAIFSPWYRSKLGIAVLLQSLSIAVLIDYAAVVRYIVPDASLYVLLIVYFALLSLVCLTSLLQTSVLLILNFFNNKEHEHV